MNIDSIVTLVDRVGAPMAILLLAGYVGYLLVTGPMMKLAEMIGGAFGQLCARGVDYLTRATERLEGLHSHVSLEAEKTRAHVTTEEAATREHVAQAVEGLRDRLSAAENGAPRTVGTSRSPSSP